MDKLLEFAPGPNWPVIAATAWWVLVILVHIGFSVAVAAHSRGRSTALVPPWLWTIATLACGPLVGPGYWFVHSSQSAVAGTRDRLPNQPMQPPSAPSGARG